MARLVAPRQLTFEGVDFRPIWSPDGSRVAFGSNREGTDGGNLFVKNVNDNSPPEAILTLPGNQSPTHWPADDVLIFENYENRLPDLWIADLYQRRRLACLVLCLRQRLR